MTINDPLLDLLRQYADTVIVMTTGDDEAPEQQPRK